MCTTCDGALFTQPNVRPEIHAGIERKARKLGIDEIVLETEVSGVNRRGVLSSYFQYHHKTRTHLSLDKDCPETRQIHLPTVSKIIAFPEVGGLHHRYERRAA